MSRSKKGKTVAIDMTVGLDEGVGLPSAPGSAPEGGRSSRGGFGSRSGFGDVRGGSSFRQPTASDNSQNWRGERRKRSDRDSSSKYGSSSRMGDSGRSGGYGGGSSGSSRFGGGSSSSSSRSDRGMGGDSRWGGGGRDRRQPDRRSSGFGGSSGSSYGSSSSAFDTGLSSGGSRSTSSGLSRSSGGGFGGRSTMAAAPAATTKKSKFAKASKGGLGEIVAAKAPSVRASAKKSGGRWGQLNEPPKSTYSVRDREDSKGVRQTTSMSTRAARKKVSPSPPLSSARSSGGAGSASSRKSSPSSSSPASARKGAPSKSESAKSAESAKKGGKSGGSVAGKSSSKSTKKQANTSTTKAVAAAPAKPPPLDVKKARNRFNKLCKDGKKVDDYRLIEAGLKTGRLDAFNAEQFGRCMAVTLIDGSCPGLNLYRVLTLCEDNVPTALLELCLETVSCLEQSCSVLRVAEMCGNIPVNSSMDDEEEEDPLADMVFDSAIYLDDSNIVEGFFRLQKSFESPEVLQEFVEYGLQYLYPIPIDQTNEMLALMRDNPKLTTIRLGNFLESKSQFDNDDDSEDDNDDGNEEEEEKEEAQFFMNLPNFIALIQFVLRKEYFETGKMLRLELDAKQRVIEEERRLRDEEDDEEETESKSSAVSGVAVSSKDEEELLVAISSAKITDETLSEKAKQVSPATIEKLSKDYGSRVNVPKDKVLNIFKIAKLNASFGEEYGLEENGNAYSVFLIYICVIESYRFSGKLHRGLVALLRDLFDARLISYYDLDVWRKDKSVSVAAEMNEGKKKALFVLSELIFDLQMRQEKRRQEDLGSDSDDQDEDGASDEDATHY